MTRMNYLKIFETLYKKVRIGSPNDGGYVVMELPGTYDVLISGGIGKDVTFEQQMMQLNPDIQTCLAFDGTINFLPCENKDPKIKFYRQNLGASNNSRICNLSQHLKDVRNAFLKIDIEGHEFRLLSSLYMHDLLKNVKQLIVEFHTAGEIAKHAEYFRSNEDDLCDITDAFQFRLFKVHN